MVRALAELESRGGCSVAHQALVSLGNELRVRGYEFTAITPASHRRVLARPHMTEDPLRRVFGWNAPFAATDLPRQLLALLELANEVKREGDVLRSNVRFSTLGGQLFVHSAFPTEAADSVFFGPDTYRFTRALRDAIASFRPKDSCTLIDIGCGSGAGGLQAASLLGRAHGVEVILSDVNPKALRYSAVNAALNGIAPIRTVRSDVLEAIEERADLIIANPPYLVDAARRAYRHGGGALGLHLSIRIVKEGTARLKPGGRLFLYTGVPIVEGVDPFWRAVRPHVEALARRYSYEEIDPDVFGEELEQPPYDRADRITVIALTIDV